MYEVEVELYADGACSDNGKEESSGGWACILYFPFKDKEKVLCGGEKNTTNNRMELMGVIRGLQCLKTQCKVNITTDSKYITDAFNNNWINKWQKNGWKTSNKQPVKNQDLWEELIKLTEYHKCIFKWIKGHGDNVYNNRCDELAVKMSKE